jgi:hypothetical protein
MGVSAILPTSTTSVPKIVSLPSCALLSGPVDVNQLKQHTLLDYHTAPSAFAAGVAPFLVLSDVQGKAILLGGSVRRVWLPFPRTSPRDPEEPLSVLNTLGVLLSRAFILTPSPSRFLGNHRSCTSHKNRLAFALCFSAFEESSCVLSNLRV